MQRGFWQSLWKKMVLVCLLFCVGASLTVFPLKVSASESAVDQTVFTTNVQGNNSSPTSVWVSDLVGYTFYLGVEGDLEMASTTDGGQTWRITNAVDTVNTTDVVSYAVWWDGWTAPGTTTEYIHIAVTDTGTDDIYYTRVNANTGSSSLSTTTTTQGASCTRGSDCQVSITKASDNVLYVAAGDTSDSWVDSCATTCTATANWSERTGAFYQGLGDDYPILTPVGGTNNVMLVYWDISADALQYNIYSATSSAWQWATNATQTIASTKDDNGTYDGMLFGMSHATTTGTTSLALIDDANDYTTQDHDINFYTYTSATGWVLQTNPVTTASGGLTGVKVAFDEVTQTWYVIYTRRTTIGTGTTGNIYYKTSTDNGTTWSAESSALNTSADDINGLTTGLSSASRIGAWWNYTTAPKADREYYNRIVGTQPQLTLSGTLYEDEGTTPITSGKTINIFIGTSTPSFHDATTNGSGAWTFTVPLGHSIGASTPITIWVDNDSTTRAVRLTKAEGTADITGLDLYQNRVIISHEGTATGATATSTTISDMSFYDSDDDPDIQYNASSTLSTLTINTGNELHIQTGKIFAPGGSVTVNGNASSTSLTDGTLHLPGTATYTAGGTTTIAGTFSASSTSSFFHNGRSTLFTATTTGKSINTPNIPLGNVTFSNTSSVTFATTSTTTDLTINTGATVVAPAATTLTISGNYTNNGTFTQTSGTTTFLTASTSWTARSASEANSWTSITYGNGLFVAVSTNGTNQVMTSPDGITWTARAEAQANQWESITYGNGLFVAVSSNGTNRVMTSSDGITWTARSASEANSWQSVTYGNGLFVAVANTGTNRVMTSPDGITWTARTAAEANQWESITYGNGLFVAVAQTGTNRVMTSPDGTTWTARSVDQNQWYSITYGNGLFVATALSFGYVMTSPDGITWTSRTPSESNTWISVTYGNGLFVAVSYSGTNRVMTSPDGITWTARSASEANSWYSVTYGNGLFVAVSSNGTNRVMTASPTAILEVRQGTKTAVGTLTGTSAFNNLAFTGAGTTTLAGNASTTNLLINSTATVNAPPILSISGQYTNNGTYRATLPWTARSASEANSWYAVTYGNGLFVAVAGSGTNRVMTSPDGITWTARSASEANVWNSVTYGNGLFVAVACGYDSASYCNNTAGGNRVMTSPDGITWTARAAASSTVRYSSVTYGNSLFVAVSLEGTVMTSPDGITWTDRVAAEANDWNSVTYGNGLFVATSWNGANLVMTSPDGITWTARAAASNIGWPAVTYGNGLFVAVSDYGNAGGTVMTSPDGITWTARNGAIAYDSWASVTYGNGLFVAGSYDGSIMTSPDGIAWTAQDTSEANSWYSITFGNGLFVAVSYDGTNRVMTSLYSTTTFTGNSAQSIGGTLSGASALGNVEFSGGGTKTFTGNASTTNFTVATSSGTVTAPAVLSISGNYQNAGTVVFGTGTTTLNGDTAQTLSGTMTGTSAFANLSIINTSGSGSSTQSVVFANSASTTDTLTMVPNTSARFLASATSTFQNISLGGSSGQPVWLRSSIPGTQYNFYVPGTQKLVTYVNTQDNNACPTTIIADDGTNIHAGNNTCWTFSSPLLLSGILYSDEGVTPITSGRTIGIAIGTSTPSLHATTTNGSGAWSFTLDELQSISRSTPIVIWVDNDTTTRSTRLTKASSTADITGLNLYQNRVIISHEGASTGATATSTTISDMSFYDSDDDPYIQYNASSTTNTLTINTGNELHIQTGKTFAPGGAVTINGNASSTSLTDGSFHLPGTATYYAMGTTTIAGSFLASSTAGFANNGRTVVFTATTTGKSINATIPLGNIIASTTNTLTFATTSTTTDLTITSGATVVAPALLTITGNYTNNGTFTAGSGTTTFLTGTTSWITRAVSVDNYWYSVVYGDGLFVAVAYSTGSGNRVMTSPDGITWTARVAATEDGWTSVTYSTVNGVGLFVAVSWDGTVMTSPDGITWTARSASEANAWYAVTYGNGLFVAVSSDGTNRVMTSPDGITWTARSASEANSWYSVTYGNGLFVAVSSDGTNRVMTSPDGITWTARSASEANSWNSVTYGLVNGSGLFVAVAGSGTNQVMTSPDGITWTARAASEANDWESVTYGNGLFVAVADTGTNRVMTSPDGITWTARTASEASWWHSVTYGNGLFVAVAETGAEVMTSSSTAILSGGSKTHTITGTATGTSAFNNLAFSGAGTTTFAGTASSTNFLINSTATVTAPALLSISGNYSNNGRYSFANSFDGSTAWVARSASEANSWYSVTYGQVNGSGLFVAVSATTTGTSTAVMTSPDGITWTARSASEANSWYSVTYGNGLFVAVSSDGANRVMTSPDGITWTARSAAQANSWNSVTYGTVNGSGLFVAVSYGGTGGVMTSPDGITWTLRTADVTDYWYAVTYGTVNGSGLFVATGDGTDSMSSPDGITWTHHVAEDGNEWRALTYGNGLFVAASRYCDCLMTSPDGITWTARSVPLASSGNQWRSITYGNGLFVAVAQTGTNRVMTSPDGITWTARSASEANSWFSVTYGTVNGTGVFVAVSSDGTNRVMTNHGEPGLMVLNGASAQTLSGTMTGSSTLGSVSFVGAGTKTFSNNASTTNFTIEAGATAVAPATKLTIGGNYTNNGTFTAGSGTTTFRNTGTTQIATGTMTGTSAFNHLEFIGGGNKVFGTSASSTNFLINSTATVTAPVQLSVSGHYTNSGRFSAIPYWTGSTNSEENSWWSSITYGLVNGLGLFVAVANGGNTNRVMTSPDGITWTARSASEANVWNSVTYGNGLFVAVSSDGANRVMTSPDGITWTARSASEANSWYSVTYGNGLFVAVAYYGTNRVMTSPDGITWTARSASEANQWYSVTYGNGLFVAVAGSGTNRVMTSFDGITWTQGSAIGANQWESVTYGHVNGTGLFVAVSNYDSTQVMTSRFNGGITFNGSIAQVIGGTLSGASALGNVSFTGAGTKTFNASASTTNFVIDAGATAVAPVTVLTIGGNYTNNGTYTHNAGTTTLRSDTTQTLSGTMTGTSAFGKLSFSGIGNKTFANNASSSHFLISASSSVTAPSLLTIGGNYRNTGTFIAGTGTTTFSSTTIQTLAGTMTGTSTFANLHIINTSGSGSSTQSVIFANSASTTDTFTMSASTSAQFLASATSTFQNISLSGASGQPVYLRSSSPNTQYNFYVPGTQKLVTYVDVRDSNACPTTITTTANTSNNSGNNTCWTFPVNASISSTANQLFAYNQGTTSISTITVTDAATPTITDVNDLRVVIATTSANMRFDTTDTTATFGGSASAKVSGTVSYLGDGEVLVIDVTSDFTSSDTLTISDLSFAQFATITTATTALGVRTDGAGTSTIDSDDKTIGISGSVTLANHTSGQVPDNFSSNTQTGTPLFAFNLTPAGESADISSLIISLQGIYGVQTGDMTNAFLYRDMNSNKAYDAGDVAVGGTGVVSISGQTGTITFSTTFSATTTQDYLLVSDIASLTGIDGVTIALNSTDITTTGVTTALTITETGSITSAQHVRVSRGGGGAIGGPAPEGQGVTTGGGQGGGGSIDSNSGDTIGNAVGFNAPSTHGTPFSAWTNGSSAYSSDGIYATTSGTGAQHSYGNFGFMVPSNNTITGIAVKLEASGSTADGTISVRLSWNGGSSVTSLQTTGTLTGTDAVYTLGGGSDLWGHSWTPAELDNGNFTIELVANPNSNTIQVDAIQVRVYHQATGGGGGGGGAVFKEPQRFFASISTAFEPVREVLKDTLYAMLRWLFV